MKRALTVALLLLASTANAHTYGVERSAVLQVHTSHAELLLIYVEPAGPRVQRLLALYDQNKNGQIDGLETRLARREFLRRAFYGLDIEFGAKSKEQRAELRFKRDKDGGISVAILQRIDLIVPKNELGVSMKVAKGETIPPITVIVEPVSWEFENKEHEEKVELEPGASREVKLTRTPTPPSGKTETYVPPIPKAQ